MNNAIVGLASIGLVLVLAACSTNGHKDRDFHMASGREACKVNVHLDAQRKIYVDQEPARKSRCPGAASINFFLRGQPRDTFEVSVIGGPTPRPTCGLVPGPGSQEYECKFTSATARGEFKYKISVNDGSSPPIIPLDPVMIND